MKNQALAIRYKGKTAFGQAKDGIEITGSLVYDEVRDQAFIWTKDFGPHNDKYRHAEPFSVDPKSVRRVKR